MFNALRFKDCCSWKKSDKKLFLRLILILLTAFHSGPSAFGESALPSLSKFSKECFRNRKPFICQKALAMSESLQSRAEAKKNFACQTMALGLAAEVIMSQMNSRRGTQSEEVLDKTLNFCKDL